MSSYNRCVGSMKLLKCEYPSGGIFSRPSISWSNTDNWNDTTTLQSNWQIVLALLHKPKQRWTINIWLSYTFTFYLSQYLAHLKNNSCTHMLLCITSMLLYLWKYLHALLHTMTHSHIHEHTYTLTLCFMQSYRNLANMLASSSTYTSTSLLWFSHSHYTYSHLWTHLIFYTQTHTKTFDHRICVCNVKCNLLFCFCRCWRVHEKWRINPQM